MSNYCFSRSSIYPDCSKEHICELCNSMLLSRDVDLFFNKYTGDIVCRPCIELHNLDLRINPSIKDKRIPYHFSRSNIDPHRYIEYTYKLCNIKLVYGNTYDLFFNKYTTNVVCRSCIINHSLSLKIDSNVEDEMMYNPKTSCYFGSINNYEDY